jgi:Type IV secretion system pilin
MGMRKLLGILLTSLMVCFFITITPARAQFSTSATIESPLEESEKRLCGVPDLYPRCCSAYEIMTGNSKSITSDVAANTGLPGSSAISSFVGGVVDTFLQNKVVKSVTGYSIPECIIGVPQNSGTFPASACTCVATPKPPIQKTLSRICNMYNTNKDKLECIKCVDTQSLPTGIGCIPLSFSTFIQDYVFRVGLGIAGVTALLMIIWTSFELQTSEGNPERVKKAWRRIIVAGQGLAVIILSLFILQLIGVNILGLSF